MADFRPMFEDKHEYKFNIFGSVYTIHVTEYPKGFVCICKDKIPKELKIIIDSSADIYLSSAIRQAGFRTDSFVEAICSEEGFGAKINLKEYVSLVRDNQFMTSIMSGGKKYTFVSFAFKGQEYLISEENITDEEFELLRKSYEQLGYRIESETERDAYLVKRLMHTRAPERYNLYYLSSDRRRR